MRKKIALGVGLVAVVLAVTVLACDRMAPAQPPLQMGMSPDEVHAAMRGIPRQYESGGLV